MTVYLQSVELPGRCFLHEVLLWVAFQRLPVAMYDGRGEEIRDSTDIGNYAIEVADAVFDEAECRRVGIPLDPEYKALFEDTPRLEPSFYYDLLQRYRHDEIQQEELERQTDLAVQHYAACAAWQAHYLKAIEYPASQIFVALRGGRLEATGRLLPAAGKQEALAILDANGQDIYKLPRTRIPETFWTLQGIDFEASAAWNETVHYCHISLITAEVISAFPGAREVVSVERVGDSFALMEAGKPMPSPRPRGRPSYPWDRFHLEVAIQLQRNDMPPKKEAAIQHFQTWFAKELGIRPSRAAIGEKLTPYYEKFVRRGGQKI
jgi:hypothetical protein